MARIKGSTVKLYTETITGYDKFGAPIVETIPEDVENVLIAEPTSDDITSSVSLYGKQIRYILGIPKGDAHDWTNKKVEWSDAYGNVRTLRTFGFPITGIEANIPAQLPWHMKVWCEEYG